METLARIHTPFLWAWLGLSAVVFAALLFVDAPYGRYSRGGFGPTCSRRWGWIIMETPAVFGMVLFFGLGDRHTNPMAVIFLSLWLLHYLRRTYLFPFQMRGDNRHMLLLTVVLAVVFNFANTYLIGTDLFHLAPRRSFDWLTTPQFIIGAALFFTGMGVNIHSDRILRNLRAPGETDYKIPNGGLFRYVSAANYSGELLEWLGFAIATWSIGALVFFIWSFANLVPRALAHHRWYQETFPDYPTDRKALVPFIL